ncbi:tetratricopeptide repeat protein [Amycolatopsis sp. cmx-11-12]|uniref:tetratricopeptide repeat protein n=1 Tax=Amycolatopsis sp. cmx-11-12 TaxID=2785795 RepID=UPI003917D7B1
MLDTLGLIAHRSGDQANALKHYHAALTLFRQLGNTYLEADTLVNIAYAHAVQGDTQHSRDSGERALQLYRIQGRRDEAAQIQRHFYRPIRPSGDEPAESAALSPSSRCEVFRENARGTTGGSVGGAEVFREQVDADIVPIQTV